MKNMSDDSQSWVHEASDYISNERNIYGATRESNRFKFCDTKPLCNKASVSNEVTGWDASAGVSNVTSNTPTKKGFIRKGMKIFRNNINSLCAKINCFCLIDHVWTENLNGKDVVSEDFFGDTMEIFNDATKKISTEIDEKNSRKSVIIETLKDFLEYFNLSSCLEQLENSLEDVRRNKQTKEDHEECFKQIDKEIRKLSFKYHPDKVTNKRGTEEEIIRAQKVQTAINATRTALKHLNSAFIEDIGIDHKFGFYTHLSINSLLNEDEVKQYIYEVILEIGVISRIKQQNIISEIRKFLIESEYCIASYLSDSVDFKKYRDSALFHLKRCIQGFETLSIKLEKVKERYRTKNNCQNMYFIVESMENEAKSNFKLLKLLNRMAKTSLKGKFNFFKSESMDSYFVRPLVYYTNVILMCDVMMRSSPMKLSLDPYFPEESTNVMRSDCNIKKPQVKILEIIDYKIQECANLLEHKGHTKRVFLMYIKQISKFMKDTFKVENYNVAITTDLHTIDLERCMTMMREFLEKQVELSETIKEFKEETKKVDEKYERVDEMLKDADSLSNEDDVKQHISEVILEIVVISRTKQQNIISEIRKFLIESGYCITSYLGDRVDFEKYRDSALFHLKCCIKGFETLSIKLENVKEQYRAKKNCQKIYFLIKSMENEAKSNFKLLKLLNKMAETSLKGKFIIFTSESMDQNYVRPLVCYTNVILMCNIMMIGSSSSVKLCSNPQSREQLTNIMLLYCNSKKFNVEIALEIIEEMIKRCSKLLENKEETACEFYTYIEMINKFMEYTFKVENYNVALTTDLHTIDLEKCMTMMREFQEKQVELSEGIKEFKEETKKMDEKYERVDEMLKNMKEQNEEIKERSEKIRILSEKVSSALSNNL